MESKNSVPSSHGKLSDTQLDNEDQSSLDENYQKLYGFNFNDTYRYALRFYKGNLSIHIRLESNALVVTNTNYKDKLCIALYCIFQKMRASRI